VPSAREPRDPLNRVWTPQATQASPRASLHGERMIALPSGIGRSHFFDPDAMSYATACWCREVNDVAVTNRPPEHQETGHSSGGSSTW